MSSIRSAPPGHGEFVELAAFLPGVDKSAEADTGYRARLSCRDIPEKVCDDTLREIVGEDLVGPDERLEFGRQPDMAPYDSSHQALMAKVVEAPVLAVSLTGCIDNGQVSGLAGPEELILDLNGDLLGKSRSKETFRTDSISITNEAYRIFRRNDFALFLLEGRGEGKHRMGHFYLREPFPAF